MEEATGAVKPQAYPDLGELLRPDNHPEHPPSQDLWRTLSDRLDPAEYKPCRVTNAQVIRTHASSGEPSYILNNTDKALYLEIDTHNYFLWKLMDGTRSIPDLTMAYMHEFGTMPFERLDQLLDALRNNGLLEEPSVDVYASLTLHFNEKHLAYRIKRFSDTAFQKEFSLKHANGFFDGLYHKVGWVLFTRPVQVMLALASVLGFACFVYLESTRQFRLLSINGSHGVGLLVLLIASLLVLFCHEMGHALTCKAYGRRIRKAGLMFYYGMPAFFVDTTDMWMEERRWPRIAVSLAGPAANIVVGGLMALVVAILPTTVITKAIYQAAFLSYLAALLNLNPLLELDGYYVLIDWLGIAQLRQKSFAFIKNRLLARLRQRSPLSREETIYTIYGVLSAIYTVFFLWLVLYLWESELSGMVEAIVDGGDILASILVSGLMVVAGTALVFALATRIALLGVSAEERLVSSIRRERRMDRIYRPSNPRE